MSIKKRKVKNSTNITEKLIRFINESSASFAIKDTSGGRPAIEASTNMRIFRIKEFSNVKLLKVDVLNKLEKVTVPGLLKFTKLTTNVKKTNNVSV
jgi:hypothetical protein